MGSSLPPYCQRPALSQTDTFTRQKYEQRARDQRIKTEAHLPEADQNLLARARPWADERNAGAPIWLRTCYAPGTDEAFSAIFKSFETNPPPHDWLAPKHEVVFDDANRFDFGSDWQRIFSRIPILLSIWHTTPEYYEAKKTAGLKQSLEDEQYEMQEVEDAGDSWSEDGPYWPSLYTPYHYACQSGVIFVADEETLTAQPPVEGKFLVAWYDPDGNVVRYNRLVGHLAQSVEALLDGGVYLDHATWANSLPGPLYDMEAPLGPPYESDDEEGNDN